MKTLLGALALILAAPVAAQAAPAADPHAGHHQQPASGQSHEQHKDCCKDGCCEKMKPQGKKMECCADHDAKAKDHSAHGAKH